MKIHNMKLMTKYFDYIKFGSKRIELRLNDEKRKNIKIGDEIIFEEVAENPRHLKTKVIDLYYENNFKNLIEKYNIELFADKNTTKEDLIKLLNDIYSQEEQEKYGIVGIRIELCNNGKLIKK